jgi:N4-gp56 family major capsid protein
MATHEFGVNHPLSNKLWSKKLMKEAIARTWYKKFMGSTSSDPIQMNPELNKVGDKLTFGLRMQMNGDGVQGDDTLEGNEEALNYYSDSILINQLRHATRSKGQMSEQRVPYSMREEAHEALADWHANRMDAAMMNQLGGNTNQSDTRYTGNNAATAPDNNHWILSTGVAGTNTEASLSASSIFSLTLLDRAVAKANTLAPLIRPVMVNGEAKFCAFLHDFQVHQLRTNTTTGQWLDIEKAAMQGGKIDSNPIYTGAIGEYNGVIMHKSTRAPWGLTGTNATARNDTSMGVDSVGRAIFLGAQAGVLCTGRKTSQNLDATWVEEKFDYSNQLGVAGGLIYGISKCTFNSEDFSTIVISSYSPDPNA